MTEQLAPSVSHDGTGSKWHFVRHLIEMVISMHVGMAAGGLVFSAALGDDARQQHPVAYLVVMTMSMTAPMAAWMRYRGHSVRGTVEMSAVMIGPALPLLALNAAGATTGPSSSISMNASTLGMLALIVYRRREYRAIAAHT